MLFYISTDIISLAQKDDKKAIEVLNRLGHSRYNNYNIVLSEREDLDILRKMESLDESAKRSYYETYIKLTSLYSLLDIIGIQVYIVDGIRDTIREEHKTIIKIPYTDLNKASFFSRTLLLFENISEIKLYNHIVNWYRVNNGLTSIISSYQPLHGGGNTISQVLLEIQNRSENFCLAILDSDRKFPNCNYGDTAKQLIRILNPEGICDYLIINTRECENLAPLSILEEICQNSVDWIRGLEGLKKINGVQSDAILYLDYKKGFRESNIYDSTNLTFINFYKSILSKTDLLSEAEFELIKQRDKESFESDNKIILHSIGHEVLERIIKNLDEKLANKEIINDFNPKDLFEEWTIIGKKILDWTCTLPHFA